MNIKKAGRSAIGWSLIDKVLKRGVQFVLSIFLARLLTPDDFGVIAMATIFVSWGEIFRDFGLGQAIIQKKDVNESQVSTIFFLNIIMGCIIAALFLGIAPFAAKFYDNEMVAWVVRVSGLTFILNSFNVVQISLFIKHLNYKIGTISSFLASTISGIVGVLLAYAGFGIWSLLVQSILSALIVTIYIWIKSSWRPQSIFRFRETVPLFKKGVGFMGQGLIDNIFNSMGSMVIGKLFSPSALGLFARGNSLAEMPKTTLIMPITRPLFPIFAKFQDNPKTLREYYLKTIETLNWGIGLLSGIFILCSKEIISILYGEQWVNSAIYLFLLSLSIPLFSNWTTITSLWKSMGKVKEVTLITFIEKFLAFLSMGALFYSIEFYAISLVATYLIANIIKAQMNFHIIGVSLFLQYREWIIEILIILSVLFLFYLIPISSLWLSFWVKITTLSIIYISISKLFHLRGMRYCVNEMKFVMTKFTDLTNIH